jgi:exosortase
MLARPLARPADLLLLGSLALLAATLFANPIRWLVVEWQQNDYYAHGPFVPVTCLVLGYLALAKESGGRADVATPRDAGQPGSRLEAARGWAAGRAWLLLAAAGLGLRAVAAALGSDFVAAVALVPTLLGAIGYLAGSGTARALVFPVGFLLFAIPLPFMDDLGFYFQRISSAGAAGLLHVVGVPATYQGAELSLPNASFVVGTPCSGLYSTVALTGLGILYARMLGLPSRLQGAALIGLLVPLAIATNVVRLGSLLSVAHLWGAEIAMAYYHNALDIVFWALAMALLLATGRGIQWIGSRAAA